MFSPKHQDLYKKEELATDSFGIHWEINKGSRDRCWGNCYQQYPWCSHLEFWTTYCWFMLSESAYSTVFKVILMSWKTNMFLAATKQLYKWYFPSVRPSVRLSHLFDYVPIIVSSWNFQELLPMTKVRSMQKVKVKVTEITTQLNRFRTVTPGWIHIWWWNDAYSLMLLRRGVLLFFKVICQISRSHGSKNRRIWPRLGVSGL